MLYEKCFELWVLFKNKTKQKTLWRHSHQFWAGNVLDHLFHTLCLRQWGSNQSDWQEAISHGAAECLLAASPRQHRTHKTVNCCVPFGHLQLSAPWTAASSDKRVRTVSSKRVQTHLTPRYLRIQSQSASDRNTSAGWVIARNFSIIYFFSVDVMMKQQQIIFYSRIIPDYIIPLGYLITTER